MFFKIKLKGKLILIISLLLFLTFSIITISWIYYSNKILKEEIIVRQQEIAKLASLKIEEMLRAKLTNLILNSRSVEVLTQDLKAMEYQFQIMFLQDNDLLEISFIDPDGKEVLRFSREKIFPKEELRDRQRDPAFVIPMFRYATEYISPVYFIKEDFPALTMAVPSFPPPVGTRALEHIRTIMPEVEPETIRGVLVAEISLSNIMRDIIRLGIRPETIYITEHKEDRVIAHTNKALVGKSFSEVEVLKILKRKMTKGGFVSAKGRDEENKIVLATHTHLPKYIWGITVQQPISLAFAKIWNVYLFAGLLFLILLSFSLIIVVWFANKIVYPIYLLHKGTEIIGKGNYDYRVQIKTNDELEQLAQALNEMAQNMKEFRLALEEARAVLEIKVRARTKELEEIANRQEKMIQERTKELQEKIAELERFNRLAVGRELKMIELKKEIKQLRESLKEVEGKRI